MRTVSLKRLRTARSILPALLLVGLLSGVASAAGIDLAIVPFDVHAQGDLGYLREGLTDMLASRLGALEGVSILGREVVQEAAGPNPRLTLQKAQAIGARLKASHVLWGSLTVIGDSLSLDARLLGPGGTVKSFFAEGKGLESLIPKVSDVCGQLAVALTGKPASMAAQVSAAPEPKPVAPAPVPVAAAAPVPAPVAPAPGAVCMTVPDRQTKGAFVKLDEGTDTWRSKPLPFEVRGLAAGDIDGDGRQEVVFIDSRTVYVYRMQGASLVEVEKWEGPRAADCLAVDVADLNGNGRAEVYVSALVNHRVSSFVLERGAQKLEIIAKELDHYLRVIDLPHEGRVLVGQRMDQDHAFKPNVYRLAWKDGRLETGEVVTSRPEFTVFNALPIEREGTGGFLALLPDDLLHLYVAGEETWRSHDYYAGSTLYVETHSKKVSREEGLRDYIPQRVVSLQGGRLMAAAANKGILARWLKTLKQYNSGGEVKLLAWSEDGLKEAWASRPIEGYIADLATGDLDGDGAPELLVAVSMKSSWNPLARTRSELAVYRLPAP